MESHCILCGAEIKNAEQYEKNKAGLIQKVRYQDIIDVLLDSPRHYDLVAFDHQDQLASPYRAKAFRNENELRKERGKGAKHYKEPDIVAVQGKFCDIVIEEELRPRPADVQRDIDITTPCVYLWTRGQEFELKNAYLFVVINENTKHVPERAEERTGVFRGIIVCTTRNFKQLYESYYLRRR